MLKALPYQGPRWYSRQATQWMLMRGVATRSDLKLRFDATARLPADVFKNPLDEIEAAMAPEFRKQAVNSLLGIWSVDRHYKHVVSTQQDKESIAFNGQILTREAPGGLHDVIYRQQSITMASMRPIVHMLSLIHI